MQLIVDRVLKRVVFKVTKNNKIVNLNIYWTFDSLKERINAKLSYLALIMAKNKYTKGKEYFLYYSIEFYKLKSFNSFLDMLERGKIKICFNVEATLENNKIAKINDRGTCFLIDEKDLTELYNVLE